MNKPEYSESTCTGRQVILYIAMSLDGFIADNKGGVSWIGGVDKSYNEDYGYGEFISNIDTVIIGYNTYRQVVTELAPDEWVYMGLKSYVLTHRELKSTDEIEFTNENICDLVKRLKLEKGKDIWICGGANIVNQLVKADFIDEYHLTIMPILLGSGISLFLKDNKSIELECKQAKVMNGVLDCVYVRRNKVEF